MAWTMKSSRRHCSAIVANSASRLPGSVTSAGMTRDARNCSASAQTRRLGTPPGTVELGAEDEDQRADVEEHQRDHDAAEAAIGYGEAAEVLPIQGEQARERHP